jgi:hypothetical protein
MKQIVLKIPENKYSFVMELLRSLKYLKIEEEYPIPEEHKNMVRERSAASEKDPSRTLDWDEAKDNVKL